LAGSGTNPDFPPVELDALQRAVWAAIVPYRDRLINIAYSGGTDSTALLFVIASLRSRMGLKLRLLHVNHGWNEKSEAWAVHCNSVSRELGVPFESFLLGSDPSFESHPPVFAGSSKEARARDVRYRWFSEVVDCEDVLLTGHHLDDQAETLLLRLMRGSSVRGLAAMRSEQTLDGLKVVRPFLNVPRGTLVRWVSDKGLRVLDDPSNNDDAFDRNFLRHAILPRLCTRWPETAKILGRAALQFEDTQMLLDEVAAEDFARCRFSDPSSYLFHLGVVSIEGILGLSRARLLNVFRFWARVCTLQSPSERALREFIRQLETAGPGSSPSMKLGSAVFRTYQDGLFLVPCPVRKNASKPAERFWDGSSVKIYGPDIELVPKRTVASGFRAALLSDGVIELRWRRGSTRVTPLGRGPQRHTLRKVLQEIRMPPWERDRIPLIFVNGEFAGMPQAVVDQSYRAGAGEAGLEIHLRDLRESCD
tara:strand:+ start:365 stop:1798 length:1434 start_codon:yes stop_codon:yes gene_type:complete